MRVLFLSHRLPYAPNRGDRVRAYHLLHEMSRWAEVDLVSLVHDADEASHVSDLKGITASITTGMVPRIANAIRSGFGLVTRTPTTHTMLRAPGLQGAIDQLTAKKRPDVVFAFCTGIGPLAMSPSLHGIPMVLDMVDVDSAKWDALSRKGNPPVSWIYGREARRLAEFEREMATAAKVTLVVTDKEKDTLKSIAPAVRIEVVPNGVDATKFKRPEGSVSTGSIAVFCGVMNYEPNVAGVTWMAREVWPLVRQKMPAAQFKIVGSHPTAGILALANSSQGIEVTGEVPDVQPHLWSAAIAVAPLLTARGVQNKVLEAVAAGLPVVVTPVVAEGLPKEISAACTTATDASAFATAILDLLGRSEESRRAKAGQADVDALSWERRLAPLEALVRDVVVGGLRPETP